MDLTVITINHLWNSRSIIIAGWSYFETFWSEHEVLIPTSLFISGSIFFNSTVISILLVWQLNTWGYSTINFFSPMTRYAANGGGPLAASLELKKMVKALHDAGIEVRFSSFPVVRICFGELICDFGWWWLSLLSMFLYINDFDNKCLEVHCFVRKIPIIRSMSIVILHIPCYLYHEMRWYKDAHHLLHLCGWKLHPKWPVKWNYTTLHWKRSW